MARAVFMGSAPTHREQNRGLDDRQINLGVIQPGEKTAIFGDALRRLTNQARFMHSDMGRTWYSTSPSLNRLAADRAGQIEEALVLMEVDKALKAYIDGIDDRGHFDTVQVAPSSSADIPDEGGGVRAVVLGVAYPHSVRDGSEALTEAQDILMQRGATPRVYRNTLVFLAADTRQVGNLKDGVRAALAWEGIVRDTERLDLTQSDSALARQKAAEAEETVLARLRECWCYLLYPYQENAQADVEWTSSKVAAQDGLLSRACKKLVSDNTLLPELGPQRLDRDLQHYIWNNRPHLSLKELWDYLNRYIYLPRLKDREVLARAVQVAVSGLVPGPFAYAERWDEEAQDYFGLITDQTSDAPVVIDDDSVIVAAEVAKRHRPEPVPEGANAGFDEDDGKGGYQSATTGPGDRKAGQGERLPTRFTGTVMISSERPARDMNNIIEGDHRSVDDAARQRCVPDARNRRGSFRRARPVEGPHADRECWHARLYRQVGAMRSRSRPAFYLCCNAICGVTRDAGIADGP